MTHARLLSLIVAALLFVFTVPASVQGQQCAHFDESCEFDSDCCSDSCDGDCLCSGSGNPCQIDDDCCDSRVCVSEVCADQAAPTPARALAPALGSPTSLAFALTALGLLVAGATLLSRRVRRDG